ncbi:MAG: hypothetical protein WC856_20600 [Methylococcaceae bacterium]|jgi:hypothetical protein
MLLLNPLEVSTKTAVDLESIEYREQNRIEKRRQWALNAILMGGDGLSLPPM